MIETFIGFDSAWSKNNRGAICAAQFDGSQLLREHPPELLTFAQASEYVRHLHSTSDYTLIAIDQPTIVPNATGMRPVEKVAASVVSWVGGGVQPANRSKAELFGNDAPIWSFLTTGEVQQDPFSNIEARIGVHAIEVFPALSLPAMHEKFCGRKLAAKYNPANRKKFKPDDWTLVCDVAMSLCKQASLELLWHAMSDCSGLSKLHKNDQDRVDAVLCLTIALAWHRRVDLKLAVIGDLRTGYIVTVINDITTMRLRQSAAKNGVSFVERNDLS